jgi:hypothetical protein
VHFAVQVPPELVQHSDFKVLLRGWLGEPEMEDVVGLHGDTSAI